MKKYYIETYGCQMNVYDSELIEGILNKDYLLAESPDDADVIMLNTCSVREHAEDKIHSRLGELNKIRMEKPGLKIGIVGCMAQNLKKELMKSKTYVNFVAGPDTYRRLPEIIEKTDTKNHIVDTLLSKYEVYDGLFPSRKEGINAWISIMRGCDKFCTFCIVPYTRGRERSRSIESIVEEAKIIVENGFVEITLLGQNVNSFHYEDSYFPDLLKAVAKVEGIKRIRYTSPHPQDVDEYLLEVHRDYAPLLANHIHLPLQSGSDSILTAMNRTYTRSHYLKLVDKIRSYVPDMAISTDIIVGFPGETEAHFQETLELMKTVKFDSAFMFKYSPRPGTKAALMDDDVSEADKTRRLNELIALQNQHTFEHNKKLIGSEVEILVEKISKKRDYEMMGRTSHNKIVIFPKLDYKPKQVIRRSITDAQGISLFAK